MIKEGFNLVARGSKYLTPSKSMFRKISGKVAGRCVAVALVFITIPAVADAINTLKSNFGSK